LFFRIGLGATLRKLKILLASEFFWPSVGGAQEVVHRLAKELARSGHQVTVVTTRDEKRAKTCIDGIQVKEFAIYGNAVRGVVGEVDSYKAFLLRSHFDVILFYAAQQWTFDCALDVLDEINAKKVLVPCGFSGLMRPEFRKYFIELPQYLEKIDHLVFLSDKYQDAEYAKKHSLLDFSVIPNGSAWSEFEAPLDKTAKSRLLKKFSVDERDFIALHVGSHTGLKGHHEAIAIFNRAKIPNSTLLIVGNVYSKKCAVRCLLAAYASQLRRSLRLSRSKIICLKPTREETVALYKAADVFLFPSNRECSPIVLFEAAASSTPFIASKAGNSEEIAAWTGGGLIIDTDFNSEGDALANIEDGAKKLNSLAENRELRNEFAFRGRESWEKEFTWEKIASRYEALFLHLVDC
jgi:L-malate glycosyltransferase